MNGTIWKLAAKKPVLQRRQSILEAVRRFFIDRDFLAVETPNRVPAPAPETHIDIFPCRGWFLHPSPEICMKRLLAAGYEKVFQICKCYREGERGTRHLTEFTLLEWYRAGADYTMLMTDCEELFLETARSLNSARNLVYQGHEVDLSPPWERLTVEEAFRRHAAVSAEEALSGDRFEEILVDRIEPHLGFGKPTFLCDYPLPLASLARTKRDHPSVAERFELYLFGMELANGFSELTDADEQRYRFQRAIDERSRWGKPALPLPEPFLEDLTRMPESAGIALGLDRLVMVLTDSSKIDQVVAFTPEML
ncbi:MAG: EF-P lysine aminoacylase EpmA [Syntrophales bacterium]|nr:EF-P lysine aminoacylase EpmA [Syntrophales bacterium]